jgi:carbonic anhydrase
VCEVDGPAAYLNIATRHKHIQNRRSMGIHHNPHLWQSLPAKSEFEFKEQEDVRRLNKELARLDSQILDANSPDIKKDIISQQRKV